ncbi:spore coat protein [Priestia megaterium]
MEVKTTDTDIVVNLQLLLQVLVAILVSLDIP